MSTNIQRRRRGWALLLFFSCATIVAVYPRAQSSAGSDGELEASFEKFAKPFLKQNCLRCHEGDTGMGGVRIDQLDAKFEDRSIGAWEAVRERIDAGTMPPRCLRMGRFWSAEAWTVASCPVGSRAPTLSGTTPLPIPGPRPGPWAPGDTITR